MPSYRWVEISDFPKKGDFYDGDVLWWVAHSSSGLHGGLINPRVRPGEVIFTRQNDQDSHLFIDHVLSGGSLPNARFVTQETNNDSSDSVIFTYAAWVENLTLSGFRAQMTDGKLTDEFVLSYKRIETKYTDQG